MLRSHQQLQQRLEHHNKLQQLCLLLQQLKKTQQHSQHHHQHCPKQSILPNIRRLYGSPSKVLHHSGPPSPLLLHWAPLNKVYSRNLFRKCCTPLLYSCAFTQYLVSHFILTHQRILDAFTASLFNNKESGRFCVTRASRGKAAIERSTVR